MPIDEFQATAAWCADCSARRLHSWREQETASEESAAVYGPELVLQTLDGLLPAGGWRPVRSHLIRQIGHLLTDAIKRGVDAPDLAALVNRVLVPAGYDPIEGPTLRSDLARWKQGTRASGKLRKRRREAHLTASGSLEESVLTPGDLPVHSDVVLTMGPSCPR